MNKLSVIILCHNNLYIDCVVSRIKSQLTSDDELIVMDDHSDCDVRELLRVESDGVNIVIPQKSGNRAHNRNYAAELSKGDVLMFVDGDILLEDGAIEYVRKYKFDDVSGMCGSVAAMQIVPEEANIILKSLYNSINWRDVRDFDFYHRIFPDGRGGGDCLAWNRFYSAICIVPREKFFSAGTFDEYFSGWGGEDIDLGYRLSALGRLTFDDNIRGIHIPHSRNQLKNELTSRKNMYAMLSKYRNRDMEELLSFACSQRAHDSLDYVIDVMKKVPDHYNFKGVQQDELCLNAVSSENPDGCISYMNGNNLVQEGFLGLALPFEDGQFCQSKSDTRLFDYPVGLSTRIMQELLRVSKTLIIRKVPPINFEWGDIESQFKHVFCYYKIKQFCDSYSDFEINDRGDFFIVTMPAKA